MNWTWFIQGRGARVPSLRATPRTSLLRVEQLEDRSVPATTTFPFTANAFGGGNFNPFPGFTGQIEYASGDVNGDRVADIIAAEGPGPGSQSEVRIFDGAAAQKGQAELIADFFPYSNEAGASQTPGFTGGVYVAAANLLGTNGSAGTAGTTGTTGTNVTNATNATTGTNGTTGTTVTTGTGDAQLVTSTGAGGQGNVKVFDFQSSTTGQFLGSNPTLLSSFIVYPGYEGDVPVAAVSAGVGSSGLIITASGAGTTNSDVRVFSNPTTIGQVPVGTAVTPAEQMFAFPGYLGGVSIAAGGTSTDPQLYLEPSTGTAVVSAFNLTSPLGGVALTPDDTFTVGTGTYTNNFLASADVNNTGTLDLLTSSFGANGSTPISAYSIANGTDTTVTLPSGFQTFQGFGDFGNSFLNSSVFEPLSAQTAAGVSTAATTTTTTTSTSQVSTVGNTTPSTVSAQGTTTVTGSSTATTGVASSTLTPSLNNGLTAGVGTSTGVNTGLGGTTATPSQTSLAQTGSAATTGGSVLGPGIQ